MKQLKHIDGGENVCILVVHFIKQLNTLSLYMIYNKKEYIYI